MVQLPDPSLFSPGTLKERQIKQVRLKTQYQSSNIGVFFPKALVISDYMMIHGKLIFSLPESMKCTGSVNRMKRTGSVVLDFGDQNVARMFFG